MRHETKTQENYTLTDLSVILTDKEKALSRVSGNIGIKVNFETAQAMESSKMSLFVVQDSTFAVIMQNQTTL